MSRHPAITTTLEEDLKLIGLLSEEGPEKDAPPGEPASNKASKARNVGAMSDDPDDEGETGTDDAEGTPHAGKPFDGPNKAAPPVPMKGDGKQESKKGPKGASAVSEALNRIRNGRTQEESTNALSVAESLIESARSIMGEIAESHRAESVKAFANVSVIAEMLSKGFAGFASKYDDGELSEASDALEMLSSEASEIAQVLDSEDEVDDEAVEAEFRNQMEALVSSLDLYSDIVEADEHLDTEAAAVAEGEEDGEKGDDDGEDGEDDDKKKDKKDDDDDGEDEKDESVRFKTPLIKKGGKSTGTMSPSTGARASLTMSKQEAYMPYGKGKGPMVSKPGKAGKPTPAKESKK